MFDDLVPATGALDETMFDDLVPATGALDETMFDDLVPAPQPAQPSPNQPPKRLAALDASYPVETVAMAREAGELAKLDDDQLAVFRRTRDGGKGAEYGAWDAKQMFAPTNTMGEALGKGFADFKQKVGSLVGGESGPEAARNEAFAAKGREVFDTRRINKVAADEMEFGPLTEAFRVKDGRVEIDPYRFRAGVEQAKAAKALTEEQTATLAKDTDKAEAAVKERIALMEEAGVNPKTKALLLGGGRGAVALAGAKGGAMIGGRVTPGPAQAKALGAFAGSVAGAIGASMGERAIEERVAKHSETLTSLRAAGALEPRIAQGGELAAFVVTAPAALGKLATATRMVAEDSGKKAAAGFVLKQVGKAAAIGAGVDTVVQGGFMAAGVQPEYSKEQLGITTAISALLAGHGVKLRNLGNEQVGNILIRGLAYERARAATPDGKMMPKGVEPLSREDALVYEQATRGLEDLAAQGLVPAELSQSATQMLSFQRPITHVETTVRAQSAGGLPASAPSAPTPAAPSATPTPQPAPQATPARPVSTVSGSSTSAPVVVPPGGVVEGANTVVFGAKGSQFPARYVWASTGLTQTSHAGEMMGPNPNYPLENTRDYLSNTDEAKAERDKQLDTRNNFDPRRHVTDATDASIGPRMAATIIDEDGDPVRTTLGGNNRGWAIANLPAAKRAELRALENAKAANFGLAPTNDPDAELQRDLGTFDLRVAGERERLQEIIHSLNPSPGQIPSNDKLAANDAAFIDPNSLVGMDMTISPSDASKFLADSIRDGRSDRSLTAGIASSPTEAQDYMLRLLAHAAFRTPVLVERRMDARAEGGALRGMLDAAIPSLLRLRSLGDDGHTAADAVVRTFTTALNAGGRNLAEALDVVSRQTEFDPASIVARVIAQGLQAAIVPGAGGAKAKPLAEPTAANARTLFTLIDRTVRNWQVEQSQAGDLLGGRQETVGDAVIRAVTHFVDKGLASASEGGSKPVISKAKPKDLDKIIAAAKRPATSPVRVQFANVTQTDAMLIQAQTGVDAANAYHVADDHFVRHVLSTHGPSRAAEELARGNVPVTEADILSLPKVVSDFDRVTVDNRNGVQTLTFEKTLGGTIFYVATGPNKNGRILAKTMWKKPSRPQQSALPPPLPTSKQLPGMTSSTPAVDATPPEIVNDSPLFFAVSGSAYANVPLANLPNIKAVEMPELHELVRELTGSDTVIKSMAKALGQFVGMGRGVVRLNPRIFQDSVLATKVMAHEIGHLIDFLPQGTLKRGNLWGRLHSLRSYMKDRWTPTGPKNSELRDELIALTEWWKPIDRLNSPNSYIRYRESGVELYADFISVLLNSPADAKRLAPKFFRNFFQGVQSKPEVKAAMFELQNWLNRPFMTRQADRRVRIDEMMALGEEAFLRKFEERKQRYAGFSGLVSRLKQGFFDQHSPIRDRAAQVSGTPAAQLVETLFDSHPMSRNEHWRWLERMGRTVVEPLEAAGFSLDDLGAHLFFDRVANESYALSERQAKDMGFETGGRSVIANPGGHTAKTARDALLAERLRNGLSRQTLLEHGVQKFHDEVYDVMREARKVGLFTAEQMALIDGNRDHYAAFVPLEYLDTFVPAGIMQQVGTMKDIASPFLTTLLKVLTLQRAIQFQRLKTATVDLLKTSFSAEIRLAETRLSPGGRTTPVPTKEIGWAQIAVREDGKPVWYNVPKEIVIMFEHVSMPNLDSLLELLSVPFRKVFYPMFITYNPIFQLVTNPIRDARRNALTRPLGIGWGAVLRQLPLVKNVGANPALDAVKALVKRGEQMPIIAEMLDNLAIVPGEATFNATAGVATTAFEKILQEHGLLPADEQSRWLPTQWPVIGRVLTAIQTAGRVNELLPKVDIYGRLRMLGWSPKEAAMFVRNATGTPNFGRKGKHANIPGAIFPFFNIWTKAWATDAKLASKGWKRTSRPGGTSAAAWWMRWALLSGVPRTMKIAGGLGLLGAGVKRLMDGIGEHDKANYDVIPVGYVGASEVNPDGKVAYIRIPKDPTDRLITGIYDNLLTSSATALAKAGAFGDEIAQANANVKTSLTGTLAANLGIVDADVPGLNPLLKIGSGWKDYLGGKNPFDDFRDRHVLSEDEHLAGGVEANKTMLAWTLGQMGTQSFFRYNPRSETTTEIAIDNTPVVNGFLKVTDYGYRQQQEAAQSADKMPKAEERLDLPSDVRALRQEFTYLQSLGTKFRSPAQTQRYEALKGWDKGVYQVGFEQLLNSEDATTKKIVRKAMLDATQFYKR